MLGARQEAIHAMELKIIFVAILLSRLFQSGLCAGHQIKRRSSNGDPRLQMTVTHFLNNSLSLTYGSEYEYGFVVKHYPDSLSDAFGVHVTWMLTPFVKINEVKSSSLSGSYRVEQKGDSVTFKIDLIPWMREAHFIFSVIFDRKHSLKTGRHHIVTPVQLLYYKEYSENPQGEVLSTGAFFSAPLQTVAMEIEIPGCSVALGMASGKIKDYQLTASSAYPESQPNQARPSGVNDAWCASITNTQQYIQLDFTKKTRVTSIVTYGRSQKEHWVKRYVIQYSDDEEFWHNYTENGFIKEFVGNSDRSTPVLHQLYNDMEGYSLRLRPLDWERLICMRYEVYGCETEGSPENCIYPLGLESGYIPDEALSHSVDATKIPSDSSDIRLNKVPGKFPNGWQAEIGQLDYLQVDFGSLRKVTRVATQGSGGTDFPFYVESFKFKYSNNSVHWLEYSEYGKTKELNGPRNRREAKYPVVVKLLEPIMARYVRFIPTSAPGLRVMRAELYGCTAEPMPPYDDVPEYSRRAVLLDPDSGGLYVCMYTEQRYTYVITDVSIDSFIISVIALDRKGRMLFGLDRKMNFHRSTNHGASWKFISPEYFYDVKKQSSLIMSTGVPENMVSVEPDSFWSASASSGTKWAVSGSGIHMMTVGQREWTMVATWKCCDN